MGWQQATVLAMAAGLAAGCAEHLHSLGQSGGWSTGMLFWPPPPATSTFVGEPVPASEHPPTFGDVAVLVGETLRDSGYVDPRWLPIGAHCEHGFAVATRIERIGDDGASRPGPDRWLAQYPLPATLHWLAGSSEAYLPARGRYRVLLVAFTDLYVLPPGRPERWDATTAMEGLGTFAAEVPVERRVPPGYRLGLHVYEYVAPSGDGEGHFVDPGAASDERRSAPALMRRPGLSALATVRGLAGSTGR
jgi:hypothetical protein